MTHQLKYQDGTDARDYTVKCSCGWAYSGTWITIRKRAPVHSLLFRDEDRKWNDPRRQAHMPGAFASS